MVEKMFKFTFLVVSFFLSLRAFSGSFEVHSYLDPSVGLAMSQIKTKVGLDFCKSLTKEIIDAFWIAKAHSKPRCSEIKFSKTKKMSEYTTEEEKYFDRFYNLSKKDDIQYQIKCWKESTGNISTLEKRIQSCKRLEGVRINYAKAQYLIILKNKKDQAEFMNAGKPTKSKKAKKKTK